MPFWKHWRNEIRDGGNFNPSWLCTQLQAFDGKPGEYVSWINRAQSILSDYEVIRGRPLNRSIVPHKRQKIRGNSDVAFLFYSVEDDNCGEVKRVLALQYADKRDIRTLEHHLSQMTQGNSTLEKCYIEVNNQFSLILSNLRNGSQAPEVMNALVEPTEIELWMCSSEESIGIVPRFSNPKKFAGGMLLLRHVVSRVATNPTTDTFSHQPTTPRPHPTSVFRSFPIFGPIPIAPQTTNGTIL